MYMHIHKHTHVFNDTLFASIQIFNIASNRNILFKLDKIKLKTLEALMSKNRGNVKLSDLLKKVLL